MFSTKIEVFNLKGKNTAPKKHIVYFPGNFASFRDTFEVSVDYNRPSRLWNSILNGFLFRQLMKSDKILSEEDLSSINLNLDIEEFKELCGDGIFISQVDDYNLHFINHHSRSLQISMLTYLNYMLFLSSIIFSSFFFVKASYGLAISFTIIAVMYCFVCLANYIIERAIDQLTGVNNFMTTGNLIRFFVKPQDPIDAGVAYVYQLLKDGVDPSDIILQGFSWGGHIATEVLRIFEEKGVYLTLVNDSSFGCPPIELGKKLSGGGALWKVGEFVLAQLFRADYNFNPLETVRRSKSPIYMTQKLGDDIIPSEESLVELYKKSFEGKNEDPGYKVTAYFGNETTPKPGNHNKPLGSFKDHREEVFSNQDVSKKIVESDYQEFCERVRSYVQSLNKNYTFDSIDKKLSNNRIEFVRFKSQQVK